MISCDFHLLFLLILTFILIITDQQLLEILSHDDLSRDFLIAEANSSTLKQILL